MKRHGRWSHEVAILVAPLLLLLLRLDIDSPDVFQEADGARFDDSLDVPGVAAHAVFPGGVRVVVGVAIGTYHAAMIAIRPMGPTAWFSISVGDVLCSASSARAAGAVGRAAAAGFIYIPIVLVASPLLLLISTLLP